MADIEIKTEILETEENSFAMPQQQPQPLKLAPPHEKQPKMRLREQPTIKTVSSSKKVAPIRQYKRQPQTKPTAVRAAPPPALPPPVKAFLPGARCGEIFVANNARQWTFVCTFCNKSTRDIGDFICHIKMKHLEVSDFSGGTGSYYDDGDSDEEAGYSQDQDVSNCYYATSSRASGGRNLRLRSSKAIEIIPINREPAPKQRSSAYRHPETQTNSTSSFERPYSIKRATAAPAAEYLDCSSYLDVNVHTEADELSFNGLEQYAKKSTPVRRTAQATTKAPTSTTGAKYRKLENQKKQAVTKDDFVVEVIPDDDDDDDEFEDNENDMEKKIAVHTSRRPTGKEPIPETFNRNKMVNGNVSEQVMDFEDSTEFNDEQYPEHGDDELDTQNDFSHFEEEEDDDFDNQLLIAPGESMDTSSASDLKSKRRQIRGTAYCSLCNKTFQYYSLYRNHMIKHSNETPFKCVLCQKGFKSKQAIRYHMNTHQKEKQFKCVLCEASYYTENQFITHMLTHENETTFPCMVCGKILRSDKERDVHLTTHTEERPFRCEFCNKLFRLRHHLSNHLKMHRQYRCDFCKEEFTSAVHLRKPYACAACEVSHSHVNVSQAGKIVSVANTTADTSGVNPLQLYEAVELPQQPTECVDLAEMVTDSEGEQGEEEEEEVQELDDEDDDDEQANSYLRPQEHGDVVYGTTKNPKKRLTCKYCPRTYSHKSGMNYHMRNKHAHAQ